MPSALPPLEKVNNRSPVKVPAEAYRQLAATCAALRRVLGRNFTGLYLHGSLAMSGFDPRRSDIDLLGVVRRPLSVVIKRRVIKTLLARSGRPHSIEMSLVARADLVPWRHPATFQLCWSEDWRVSYRRELTDGTWLRWNRKRQRDGDLAAHLAMTRARGVALFGPPPARALPFVPVTDVVASLVSDGRWALRLLRKNSSMQRYAALNACRRLAFLRRGFLLSKVEGAEWASRELPHRWRGVISAALAGWRHPQAKSFLGWMGRQERYELRR